MIRAVIFDLGHTIWDIRFGDREPLDRAYTQARTRLCAHLGRDDLPSADALRDSVAAALRADGPAYFTDPRRTDQPPTHTWVDRGFRTLGLELEEPILRAITPPLFATEIDGLSCTEGTCETLHDLWAAGYALGCVTNTLADDAGIRAMLRLYGIEDLMSCVVVSTEIGLRKPHRALFDSALAALDVAPHEALFVGDSPAHDIAGAAAVGMRTALTTQYVTRPLDGTGARPDAVIGHVRELRTVIDALDGAP